MFNHSLKAVEVPPHRRGFAAVVSANTAFLDEQKSRVKALLSNGSS